MATFINPTRLPDPLGAIASSVNQVQLQQHRYPR